MRRLLFSLPVACLALSSTAAQASPAAAPAKVVSVPASVATASFLTGPAPTVVKPVRIAPMSRQGIARFGQKLIRVAATKEGSSYVYGSAGPQTFDCSGFTRYVYGKLGITLPHSSYAQYAMTAHIPLRSARVGDLVFLNGLGHVGIYAGNGTMWDAPTSGGHVSQRPIYGSYVVGRVIRAH